MQKTVTINGRPFQIDQFSSLAQASEDLPEALLLRFINSAWQNLQVMNRIDAEREIRRDKK